MTTKTRARLGAAALAMAAILAGATSAIGAPVPVSTTSADACGPRLAKSGGGTWRCVLADGFDTALDRSLWGVMAQAPAGDQCQVDAPATVSTSAGALHLRAVRSGTEGVICPLRADGTRSTYAVGWATTFARWSQQYGRFEVRMRSTATTAPGLQEAFWLWPDVRYSTDTTWPASGEIDVVETYSQYPTMVIPFLHYGVDDNGGPVGGLNTAWDCTSSRGEWNTYALEWSADRLSIFVNGRLCLTNTAGAASFRKPFIMNLAQFVGVGSNAPTADTALPATLDVDHVKVWR